MLSPPGRSSRPVLVLDEPQTRVGLEDSSNPWHPSPAVVGAVAGYYLCVVVLFVLSGSSGTRAGWTELAALLTFTNSFFAGTFRPGFDNPLWAMGIIVLFYFLFPLFAAGMFRCRSVPQVLAYVALVIAAIFLAQAAFVHEAGRIERAIANPGIFQADHWMVQRNALILFTHFLFGLTAAGVYVRGRRRAGVHALGHTTGRADSGRTGSMGADLAALSLAVTIAVLLATDLPARVPLVWRLWSLPLTDYFWPTVPLLLACLLVALARSRHVGRWLDAGLGRWLAPLSFGIFMWHLPIMRLIESFWPGSLRGGGGRATVLLMVFAATALAASISVAWLSVRLVERPAARWLERRWRAIHA